MKTTIFVPKTIKVGYQKRNDTYTNKLAYVIYYDQQGKLRKETSWTNWRDETIDDNEFDNKPLEGFVLNKKVGDYSGYWNEHRMAYCRVYDPRGFEIEITIENLLYILENCSSIKGKGLEGEFIYGWDGKELLLLPINSPDYKEISKYSDVLNQNISIKAKDLKIGATYIDKENTEYIYMGKHNYYSYIYEWEENGEKKQSKLYWKIPYRKDYSTINGYNYGNYHWFAYKKYSNNYDFIKLKSISKGKFVNVVDENYNENYSKMFDAMERTTDYSPYDKSKDKIIDMSLDDFYNETHCREYKYYNDVCFISKLNDAYISYRAINIENENKYILEIKGRIGEYSDYSKVLDIFETEKVRDYEYMYEKMIPVTLEEIFDRMKPLKVKQYLENGKEYEERFYYE